MRDMDLKIAEAIAGMLPEEPDNSPAEVGEESEPEVEEEPTRELVTKSVRRTKK